MQLSTSGSICELPSLCSVISLAHAAAGLYHSCGGDWETHHRPFLVQNRLRAGEQQKYTVRAAALHSSSPPTSLVSKLSFTVSGKSRYQAVSNCHPRSCACGFASGCNSSCCTCIKFGSNSSSFLTALWKYRLIQHFS